MKSATLLRASDNLPGSAIKSISITQTNLEAEILEFLSADKYEESVAVEEWIILPEEWSDMNVTTEHVKKIPGTIEPSGDGLYTFINGKLVDISKEESDEDIALEIWMLDVRSFLIMK